MGRIEKEKAIVGHLIALYCRDAEGHDTLCGECRQLLDYAHRRLDGCRYGEAKPVCQNCPTHCYRPEYREKIRRVMRYAGPRLLWHRPGEAIRHLFRRMASGRSRT